MCDPETVLLKSPDGLSVGQLAAITGKSERTCRRVIKKLLSNDKITITGYTRWGAAIWKMKAKEPTVIKLRRFLWLRMEVYRIRIFGARI